MNRSKAFPSPNALQPGPSTGRRAEAAGRRILLWISLILTFNNAVSHSQVAQHGPSLADLQFRFDADVAEINQPISQLNVSYMEALKRLMTSETASGKLDGALQVKTEIEAFGEGTDSTADLFEARKTDHPAIQSMRTKYLTERARLWNLSKREREAVLKNYRAALTSLEEDLTKLENLDTAITVRKVRDALDRDPRFHENGAPAGQPASLTARIHFVAKGDIELRHNGAKLNYRNISPERTKYVDGTSGDATISAGDIIVVKMRATAVYRGFVMSIEGIDGKTAIPIAVDDYRYLGSAISDKESNPDIETLIKTVTQAERGATDADMDAMWNEKSISDLSRARSEWIKCGPGEDWHHYAILLGSEMFQRVPN